MNTFGPVLIFLGLFLFGGFIGFSEGKKSGRKEVVEQWRHSLETDEGVNNLLEELARKNEEIKALKKQLVILRAEQIIKP